MWLGAPELRPGPGLRDIDLLTGRHHSTVASTGRLVGLHRLDRDVEPRGTLALGGGLLGLAWANGHTRGQVGGGGDLRNRPGQFLALAPVALSARKPQRKNKLISGLKPEIRGVSAPPTCEPRDER